MLRIVSSASSAAAKAYYTGSFTRGDYYTEDQEIIGYWRGRGAERLGLSGTVDREAFVSLCDNLNPITLEQLTPRTKENRRVGFDMTFDVPKSVSVLYAVTGDQRIMKAFRQAVEESMLDLERKVQTRVRANGQDFDRTTGSIIRAEFIHQTARPVDGYPDPQLHAHIYVFNATFDEVENKWKALQLTEVMKNAANYQKTYHSRLSDALKDLGYTVTVKGNAFEINGVPESVIALFSRRTEVIEAAAREQGIVNPEEKAMLGLLTRELKAKDLTLDQLKEIWRSQLTREERQLLERVAEQARMKSEQAVHMGVRDESHSLVITPAQRAAVEQAMLHCFATQSVVTEETFRATVLQFGLADMRYGELDGILAQVPELVRKRVAGQSLVTTQQVLNEEKDLILWTKMGKGTAKPLVPNHVIVEKRLGEDQRAAVKHVLESTDRVTGIEGRAGTGKTTVLKEVVAAIKHRGQRVMVMAPTAELARKQLRKDGFHQANTVEKWLRDKVLQAEIGLGAVWVVDEAGLLSVPTMVRLARLAERHDARIILVGDTNQHRSVERGDALLMLKEHADLSLAVVDTVRRQSDIYKEAVEEFSNGRLVEGFDKLDAMGAIHEIPMEDLYKQVANEYLRVLDEGSSPLVVSPTHYEIRQVTNAIRNALKDSGQLKKEKTVEILQPVKMSPAQKRDIRSFQPKQVLEMMSDAPGFKIGDRLTVVSKGPKVMRVKIRNGSHRNIDPTEIAEHFEVFQPETISLAKGDRVRITQNGMSVDSRTPFYNGTLDTVLGFSVTGDIKLASGLVVDRNFKHINWGYATTSHVSQGKTVDTVLVVESSASFGAASREQFYVSVSRGVKYLHVYTDARDELLDAVHRSSGRMSAVDMVHGDEDKPVIEPEPEQTRESLGSVSAKSPVMQAMPFQGWTMPANVQITSVRHETETPKMMVMQVPVKLHEKLGEVERGKRVEQLQVVKPPERKAPERKKPELAMEMGM